MDESGDFWRSVTTEMAVSHNKCEPAPPTAFQSVLAVAAAVMQRGTPQKKKSLTGKSGKAQPVPPTGIEPVRCFHRGILSPLRLPISPQRHAVTDAIIMLFRGFCQLGKSITAHLFSACQRHVARSIDKKRPGTLFNHRRRLYRLSAPVCCDTVGRKQNRNCHNHNETRRYATLKRTNSRNALLFSKP